MNINIYKGWFIIIIMINKLKVFKCNRCGHKWIPRVKEPVQCPKCKRTDWNRK